MKKLKYDVSLRAVKLLAVILIAAPFAACWYGCYAGRIAAPFYCRGNLLIVLLFLALYLVFAHIYDALQISLYHTSEIIYSQLLALALSDGIMFVVLCLLSKGLPRLLPAAAALCIQVILACLWAVFAKKWYISAFPPERTAVIYGDWTGLERLVRKYGMDRRFQIQVTMSVSECLRDIRLLDNVDAVFLSGVHSHDRNIILKYCVARDISTYVIPRIGDTLMSGARRMHLFHLPMLCVERYHPAPLYAAVKRLLDIVISLVTVTLLSPLMAITAIAIKASDGGPALYKQVRLTKDGKRFYVLKFRSMRVDAERDGVARVSTGDRDSRITPVGRIIRKFRVDELPQFFCILSGAMSLVGPRPERPEIASRYELEMPEFALRLQVKAGLTGYAQVYGKYNSTPYDKLQMDLMYIAHPSILEDFRILFATLKILFLPESTEGVPQERMTPSSGSLKAAAGEDMEES